MYIIPVISTCTSSLSYQHVHLGSLAIPAIGEQQPYGNSLCTFVFLLSVYSERFYRKLEEEVWEGILLKNLLCMHSTFLHNDTISSSAPYIYMDHNI